MPVFSELYSHGQYKTAASLEIDKLEKLVKMMKQVKMLIIGDNEVKFSLRLPRNFGQPEANQNWGQPYTTKILW